MHIDLDAFFAAVEQRDKPSLRGRPVIVGGTGGRGVVSTASYEARVFGVTSAMSMAEARSRCPHAAVLGGRFGAYKQASEIVMACLRELSPLVEPLSLDEAFVDLEGGGHTDLSPGAVESIATALRAAVTDRTGLTASVGAATTKTLAKIASEQAKPDGLRVVPPGAELAMLHPLPIRALWGVGPATAARLARLGVRTIGDLARIPEDELATSIGDSHGRSLSRLSHGHDPRPVVPERDSKSVSAEDTFETDVVATAALHAVLHSLIHRVSRRLQVAGLSGRTITVKARHHDFTTVSRSATLPGPTDDPRVMTDVAVRLLADIDTTGGLRLLGLGVSGLATWVQEDLFAGAREREPEPVPATTVVPSPRHRTGFTPGQDVRHRDHGLGWVWGSGLGRVTVRFEHRYSTPGPVRTFAVDDPDLEVVDAVTETAAQDE